MKKTLFFLLSISFCITASAQFAAKIEIKEDVPGICNKDRVYALLEMFKGQKEAVCPISKQNILKRLNGEIALIKTSPAYTDKGIIGLLINCKGEVVQCKMDNKTKDPELDKRIESIFNSLGKWKPGKLNGKDVDSSWLFSFEIKKGKFFD